MPASRGRISGRGMGDTVNESPAQRNLVDINVATVEELSTLVGVGRSRAEAIVETRNSLGGFTSIEDLSLAPGVGTNLIEANRQILTVSAPAQSSQVNARKTNTRNRSSDNASAQPTPSTTPVISSSSDNATEDQQNDSGSSSSNEWGACRLRQRRSTSRINPLPVGKSPSLRQTRSSDSIIQSPSPLPTTPTSSTPTAPAIDASNVSLKEGSPTSENEDVVRPGATKRKSESTVEMSAEVATEKKTCRRSEGVDSSSSSVYCHVHRNPIPSKDNPPPGFCQWLHTFQYWSNAERLCAIDQLIELCEPTQVRHMMAVIEPQFQRDFISLLPKELALYVLSFLTPRDLTRAAQTCRCWRVLAEDNLLWREKCREAGIDDVRDTLNKRRLRGSSQHSSLSCGLSSPTGSSQSTAPIITPSPWKATYMRHRNIELNWRVRPVPQPRVLKGHDDHVITCLQFCGNRIVSGSDDNTLKVWSATTGKCMRTLQGHTGGVWSSQMQGNIIVSGSTDRTLKVWNAESGQCLHTLYGHTSTVRCMHLHGNKVVSGSRDATLRVWDVETGECLHVLVGHVAAVRCVQYDGRLVVSGAYDYTVKVWDPEREECLHTLQGHTNRVYSLQFDGIHVVSGSLDTSIRVWDAETGACKHTLMGHQSLTSGMELRNNILVSGNADSTVKVWDIISGKCLQTLSGANKHQSAVTCLQFNNKFVITSSDDGTVKLWDVKTGEFIRNLVSLDSGGSGGVVWRIRADETRLVCAVGSRNGTEETKLLVLDFDIESK
ncbi:F-box/WD repeat-containing protein 7 isoform X1 [Daphnia magna]|uniref:F-box/WD repeat-containing protein 1A n=2 Tax=Daphnia magna TaxID=35525 RepID=A0A0P5MYY1_9CRUS|nr:F-box/WD repeat-containing protein 7 isoform X1 [Daphnia magna]KAK4015393.1 hypothetical protein OUZ56_030373 [Daphnia magna]KZS16245.1 F-box/WD repeat-containing protein 1A [Daphnia magna]